MAESLASSMPRKNYGFRYALANRSSTRYTSLNANSTSHASHVSYNHLAVAIKYPIGGNEGVVERYYAARIGYNRLLAMARC